MSITFGDYLIDSGYYDPPGEWENVMWFELGGDSRLGRCASERCGGQPTWRLEAGGVGSNYCSGCKEKIENSHPDCQRICSANPSPLSDDRNG